jgi:hypothetical protein
MRSLRALALIACVGLSTLAGGCPEDEDLPGERGDLGVGNFVYQCVGVTDTACTGDAAVLPQALAVGSRFNMTFAVRSGASPLVISPATDIVRREDGAFMVLQSGVFPLLAVTGSNEVVDIKHLQAAAIAEVRVQKPKELPVASLTLSPGDAVTLSAVPFDVRGVQLGGGLVYGWRSSDDARLSIETLPQLNAVRVRARAAGRATLMVDVTGKTFSVSVQVGGDVPDASVAERDAAVVDGGPTPVDGAVDSRSDAASFAPRDADVADGAVADGGVQ